MSLEELLPTIYAYGAILSGALAILCMVFAVLRSAKGLGPLLAFGLRRREELRAESGVFRFAEPWMNVIAGLNVFVRAPDYRAWLERTLAHAGSPGGFRPEEFMAICQLSAVGAGLFGVYICAAVVGEVVPLLIGSCAVLGLVYPNLALKEAVTARVQAVDSGLPYAVSLIALSMEAGLDFTSAIRRYVELGGRRKDVLREELALVLAEMEFGRTRREALEAMSARVPCETLRSLVISVVQADRLGTPLAKVLREQVQVVQTRRTQRAEKQAGEAAVKVLGPLMFIFAAVFLVLFNSMIIRALQGNFLG